VKGTLQDFNYSCIAHLLAAKPENNATNQRTSRFYAGEELHSAFCYFIASST
jgi:hypothetical protein